MKTSLKDFRAATKELLGKDDIVGTLEGGGMDANIAKIVTHSKATEAARSLTKPGQEKLRS